MTYFAFGCASCTEIYRLYPLGKQLRLQTMARFEALLQLLLLLLLANVQCWQRLPGSSICCNCDWDVRHSPSPTPTPATSSAYFSSKFIVLVGAQEKIYIFLLFCRRICDFPGRGRGLWLLDCLCCNTNPITFKIINLCTYQKQKQNANAKQRHEHGIASSHLPAETPTHPRTPTHTHTHHSHLLYQLLIDSMGNFRMSHDGDKGGCGCGWDWDWDWGLGKWAAKDEQGTRQGIRPAI